MKTKHILISSLLLGAASLAAQNTEKKATVRIKKTEVINGVEKTTDTTFTTCNPSDIHFNDGDMKLMEWEDKDGKGVKKMIVIDSKDEITTTGDGKALFISSNGDDIKIEEGANGEKKIIVNGKEPAIILNENDTKAADGETKMVKNVVVKRVGKCNASADEIKNATEEYHITIVKMIDVSETDRKLLGKPAGVADNKLGIENMDFYPNPNTGKFNLRFNLKEKGTTEVKVLNTEGKTIYSESLNNFSGTYDKEIDISQNPKGVYFVRIDQGKHSQLKKIVLE